MSWAAHDPEGWTEVCNKAIADKLSDEIDAVDCDEAAVVRSLVNYLSETQDEKLRGAYDAMLWWANDYIGARESDYLITKAGGDR